MTPEQAAALRKPFPSEMIGKLPKISCRDCTDSQGKVCDNHSKARCSACNNYITTAHVDLDYVGHAAATDRLLQVDPEWTWEPVAFGPDGLPVFGNGGLWIKLTICGVTRMGFGDAGGKSGPNAVKEAIGDAIRNASMRFGVALDLWAKADLHTDRAEQTATESRPAETDVVWAADWARRVLEADKVPVLRGLYSELVEQARIGKVSDEDSAEMQDTLQKRRVAIEPDAAAS